MIVTDWWNIVYQDIMGGSAFMMFLFGWELFMAPILFVLAVSSALIKSLVAR